MTANTAKTCQYKGRTYKLLYVGDTKFGRRAKLGFTDSSKEFWVSVGDISGVREGIPVAPSTGTQRYDRPASGRVCADCGKGGRLVRDMEDGMLKHYGCCDMPPD